MKNVIGGGNQNPHVLSAVVTIDTGIFVISATSTRLTRLISHQDYFMKANSLKAEHLIKRNINMKKRGVKWHKRTAKFTGSK